MSQYYQLATSFIDVYINDKSKPLTAYIEKAEKLSGVKRIYLAQGFIAFLALYLIIGSGAQFICNLIGFVYPAYKSLNALETDQGDDDKKWLTYWVVFAGFSVGDFFSGIFLSWFPFYWLVKVGFLLWCSADTPVNGSTIIYSFIIRPIFLKNKDKLAAIEKDLSPKQSSNKSN